MAKPSETQTQLLLRSKARVINRMKEFEAWVSLPFLSLLSVELGVLRKSAIRRHGATRWKYGTNFSKGIFSNPDVVDIHPELLNDQWRDYLDFVMYHEFIHCMGFKNHDSDFRSLESLWGFDFQRAKQFSEHLSFARAKYVWKCPNCENKYPRSRRSNGRYLCRDCKTILIDEEN